MRPVSPRSEVWGALPYMLVTLIALLLAGALWMKHRLSRASWRAYADHLSLRYLRSAEGPGLEGVYRGRVVSVMAFRSQVEIDVRVVNSGRVVDHLCAGETLPPVPWLSPVAAAELYALSVGALRDPWWEVEVVGQRLCLTGEPAMADSPERLRFLLDLACDLADGIDCHAAFPTLKFSTT